MKINGDQLSWKYIAKSMLHIKKKGECDDQAGQNGLL